MFFIETAHSSKDQFSLPSTFGGWGVDMTTRERKGENSKERERMRKK
jgi:hypothetical protein